jgi:hypothetical protein
VARGWPCFYALVVESSPALVILLRCCRRWRETAQTVLVIGKLLWLLKPRYDRDVFGVIAIPLISDLAVAASALQGH